MIKRDRWHFNNEDASSLLTPGRNSIEAKAALAHTDTHRHTHTHTHTHTHIPAHTHTNKDEFYRTGSRA